MFIIIIIKLQEAGLFVEYCGLICMTASSASTNIPKIYRQTFIKVGEMESVISKFVLYLFYDNGTWIDKNKAKTESGLLYSRGI
jgi:hypothetical protein